MIFVSALEPSGDLLLEGFDTRDTASKALSRQDGPLGLCHVQAAAMLWRVAPFEALGDAPCLGGREGAVVLPGKSRGIFDNVDLSGGPYDPTSTTPIHG